MKTSEDLTQIFHNNFDCYADTWKIKTGSKMEEGEVIPAMTVDKFVKVIEENIYEVPKSKDIYSELLGSELFPGEFSGECSHNNITRGHHPDQPSYCEDCREEL